MSRIRGKNTEPEVLARRFLFNKGLRFRLHVRKLAGKPDLVLRKYKTVIFIQGCFWHGHEGCKFFSMPKTRTKWWSDKIQKNRTNDQKNIARLRDDGWKVIEVWECDLSSKNRNKTLNDLYHRITHHSNHAPVKGASSKTGCASTNIRNVKHFSD